MKKIIIIGAGVSGLSAGIYARLNGYDVTIYEKHKIPGGNLTGWNRQGCHIDNCIHWLTGTREGVDLYDMWVTLGALGNVKIRKSESLFTCEYGGKTLSLKRDLNELETDMINISYEDKDEIKRLIHDIKTVQLLCGLNVEHKLKYALNVPSVYKYYLMTNKQLSEKFRHPLLKFFINALLTQDFMSLSTLFVFAQYCGDDADLPAGGSLAMAKRIADRFEGLGGKLVCGKGVKKINTYKNTAHSVTLEDGVEAFADYIIVSTDPHSAYPELFCKDAPDELNKYTTDTKLERFSSFQTAFMCDTDKLPFKGDYIFEADKDFSKLTGSSNLILREFSHEPDFAPENKTVLQTMSFCLNKRCLDFINAKKEADKYEKIKKYMAEKTKEQIIRKFPELGKSLCLLDVWTPATYKRFTGSQTGSYMAYALKGGAKMPKIGIKADGADNVFFATQWQRSPGGLPNAAQSGKKVIEHIVKADKKSFIS